MNTYEIARRLKGHRATHPMAKASQLEDLVEHVLKLRGENTVKPTIGRIVHYTAREYSIESPEGTLTTLPAVILAVHADETCDLLIWGTHEDMRVRHAKQNHRSDMQPNTWFWPPRV